MTQRFPPLAPPEPSKHKPRNLTRVAAPKWGDVLPIGEVLVFGLLLVLLAMS